MKLDNEKNILMYQKALYAEQLHYYSKLCELYLKLANLHKLLSAEKIEQLYSKPLALAANGYSDFYSVGDFSSKEIEIFKEYAFYSKKFNEFKEASKILSEVLING